MFLVWGFKVRFATLDTGVFACPSEGGDRSYLRQMARRWFTFFWIPLIPLKEVGEVITCESCGNQYDPRVLDTPTASTMDTSLREALRHLVVAVIGEDHQPSPIEEAAAVALLHRAGMTDYSTETLQHDRQTLRAERLEHELAGVSELLTADGREGVLRAALSLAGADGIVNDSEREVLRLAGIRLGMSEAHVRGVLSETPAPHEPSPPPPRTDEWPN